MFLILWCFLLFENIWSQQSISHSQSIVVWMLSQRVILEADIRDKIIHTTHPCECLARFSPIQPHNRNLPILHSGNETENASCLDQDVCGRQVYPSWQRVTRVIILAGLLLQDCTWHTPQTGPEHWESILEYPLKSVRGFQRDDKSPKVSIKPCVLCQVVCNLWIVHLLIAVSVGAYLFIEYGFVRALVL